jgi:hypothetical protein
MYIDQETTWPEVFRTGILPEEDSDQTRAALCADALCAWANCSIGNPPPENFGEVMVQINNRLNGAIMPEELMAWAKQWRTEA